MRNPASLTRYSRSRPMIVPQRPATHNRTIKFHSISISTPGFAPQKSYIKFRHSSGQVPAAASSSAKHDRRRVPVHQVREKPGRRKTGSAASPGKASRPPESVVIDTKCKKKSRIAKNFRREGCTVGNNFVLLQAMFN